MASNSTHHLVQDISYKVHHHELMKIVRGEGFIRVLHNLNWFMDYQNCSDVLWMYELKIQKNDIWKYLPSFRLWHVWVTIMIWKVILLIFRFVSRVIKFCFYIIMDCLRYKCPQCLYINPVQPSSVHSLLSTFIDWMYWQERKK